MKLTLSNCITLLALMSVPAVLAQSEQELANQGLQTGAAQTTNEMGTGAIPNVSEMGTDVAQKVNESGASEKVNEVQAAAENVAAEKANEVQAAAESVAAENVNEVQAGAENVAAEKVNEVQADTNQNVNEVQAAAAQNTNEMSTDATQNLNEDIDVVENIDTNKYATAVAVASFTGPTIVGEFSFYQDSTGKVVATGALLRGLVPDAQYHFRFHNGPSCESLGEAISHHSFKSMRVMDVGGTAPIQEAIEDVHLTGQNGLVGSPWVLSDGTRDVACVVLKGQ